MIRNSETILVREMLLAYLRKVTAMRKASRSRPERAAPVLKVKHGQEETWRNASAGTAELSDLRRPDGDTTFFVMLVAFSTMDNNKLKIVAGSMRDAFGVQTEKRFSGIMKMQ